jgi:hypothetical protein
MAGGAVWGQVVSPRLALFLLFKECVMPKDELDGLPILDSDESDEITVAVQPEDLKEGDEDDPAQHPVAIALRRERGVDDARVSKGEVLIRRGKQWFRYGGPKRVAD